MGLDGPFLGRSIQVVEDLNIDEQIYLYQKTSELKKAWRRRGPLRRIPHCFRGRECLFDLLRR
jgi:hypothetical protein